jgi:hypothetical protein
MISRKSSSKSLAPGSQLILQTLVALLLLTSLEAAAATPPAPLASALSDDFTHDAGLNADLWAINGPVASNFSNDNCPGCSLIALTPSFSSAGMEIANANGSSEIGAIQSVQNFTPPLTVTALVKGLVSDGHPFVFGIGSQNASSGVQVTGNLNPNDCSAENNCGNPSTCGTPANSSIPPNQCFYGIYARAGSNGGNWKKTPALDLTPAVQVVYTLSIAVDGSGSAQFNVSAGGQVLGQATAQVGTGPFYIMMAQSEGAPVPGPGPNSAVWMSVTLTPSATISPPPSSSSSGISTIEWILLILIVIVALLIIVVVWSRRRRGATVKGTAIGAPSPIAGGDVPADRPPSFSASTGTNGRVAPATPVAGPPPPSQEPARGPVPPLLSTSAPTVAPTAPIPPRAVPPPPGEEEEFGGERIRGIIQKFRAQGALSPETALTAQALGLSRIFVRIMNRRRGKTQVFVEVNGKYYLDEKALQAMR